jgi:chromosome segregation ATPase
MTTKAETAKPSKYWHGVITDLTGKRDAGAARHQQLTDRRRTLALDAQLGNDAAQKEIAKLNKELADLAAGREEIASAIEQAQQHLTAAKATEAAAAAELRQQRCKAIAARVMAAAADYDTACQAMASAAGRVKAEMGTLAAEAPRLNNSILLLQGSYTRAARHAGLRDTLDLAPTLGATTAPLATVAAGILSAWTEPQEKK